MLCPENATLHPASTRHFSYVLPTPTKAIPTRQPLECHVLQAWTEWIYLHKTTQNRIKTYIFIPLFINLYIVFRSNCGQIVVRFVQIWTNREIEPPTKNHL